MSGRGPWRDASPWPHESGESVFQRLLGKAESGRSHPQALGSDDGDDVGCADRAEATVYVLGTGHGGQLGIFEMDLSWAMW